MRISFLLVGIIFLASLPCFSQDLPKVDVDKQKLGKDLKVVSEGGTSKFQLKVYGGYGFATGNTYNYFTDAGDISDNFVDLFWNQNTTPSPSRIVVKENTKGLGSGIRVGLGLAYVVNDFINLGVDVDYFNSKISRSRRDEVITRANATTVPATPSFTQIRNSDFSYNADVVNVAPHIVFKAISRNNVYVYTRLGVSLTPYYKLERLDLTSKKTNFTANGALFSDTLFLKRFNVDLKFPIGFFASFGANFKLSGRMRLFAEAQYTSITFTPKQRTVVEYTENGQDKLADLADRRIYKTDVFTKEFTTGQTSTGFASRNIPAVRIPVTNISLLAGLTYRF